MNNIMHTNMKLIVKKLQGGECEVEVLPSTTVLEIKRQVAQKLKISVGEQKLLSLGRTLIDDHTVQSYPTIKEGSKLNLVVKKPEGIYEVTFKWFKETGMSDLEAKNSANKFVKTINDNLKKMSWDDLERLAGDILQKEGRSKG